MVSTIQTTTRSATDAEVRVVVDGALVTRTTDDARTDPELKVRDTERTDPQSLADAMAAITQRDVLDTRTLIADLASDDPDKTINPAREDIFWADARNTSVLRSGAAPVWLTSREETLQLFWDGTSYVPISRATTQRAL